ncbi:hypothetical protein VPH35_102053 [Triticum aestivum]|uniref:phospholipase A1-II 7-like n=1 Tax=Triticum aestivum TaxID=4565 RepID=UPI001D003B33|nr:phospholipase A1-II 7-like [Triticum aestivum]
MALPFPNLGAGNIATQWRELQGSGSWAGLLEPLDSDLRDSVIAYGELAEATYDVFNADKKSPEAGQCMYSETGLLAASGVSHPEYYKVTKFLYATCDFRPGSGSESSSSVAKAMFVQPVTEEGEVSFWTYTNWIGYVAVATDKGVEALGRRDIVVAWRGSVKFVEFLKDADARYAPAATVLGPSDNFKNAKVHRGFLSVYTAAPRRLMDNDQVCPGQTDITLIMTSARDQAITEVRALMEAHKDEVTSITVTGHSLGGSLATLNAVDMVAHHVNVPPAGSSKQQPCPVTVILFASPRIGNEEFKHAFASFPELRALSMINKRDKVPKLPPCFVHATTATMPIDTDRSPYLRPGTIGIRHNLECYLHGVAGDHGADGDFKLVGDRDLALVNKSTNALTEGYPVPAKWWGANYKGTVKGVAGHWKLQKFDDE